VKTTVELDDELFREAKATAAREGVSLRQLFEEALADRVSHGSFTIGGGRGWPTPRANVPSKEIWRIQKLIDEEFETVDHDDE
jgi:hypothetical protein